MENHPQSRSCSGQILTTQAGFTLIELMISVVLTLIVSFVVYIAYSTQSKSFSAQREISKMQQNLRGALHLLTWDLHNSLRDPSPSQRFRFMMDKTGRYLPSPMDTASNAGLPGISIRSLRADNDADGVAETPETVTYRVRDDEGVPWGLWRQVDDGGWALVAEGIQAIGFAYAYDADGDGEMQRYDNNPVNRVLWAVDSDNDGRLDAILDTNDDGLINESDDTNGDGFITWHDDPLGHLATPVSYDRVRAVRIFIMAVSERPSPENIIDNRFYTVGNRIIQPPRDRFIRRLVTQDVGLRNYIR